MYRVLFVAAIILKIFMFRDAVKRGVPTIWYWLIAFMPFGEVIYFFVFPFDETRFRQRFFNWFRSPRARYAVLPNVRNKFDLAQALYDEGKFEEAQFELEALLRHSESHKEALFLLGMTRLQLEDYDGATRPFQRLVDTRAGFRDYAAWVQLAYAHYEAGRPEEAIEQLERLVERSGRLQHRVILAEYLIKAERTERARAILNRALRSREKDSEWAQRAARLADSLG
ncbi:MAG TPA: tetratricopeptide repeat protein [Polyangiaceae bacterium]|nr:tetratricopeptide repeat protein [Polyangiaceae bacterium]